MLLCVSNKVPIHEIWAISTLEGKHAALEKLLAVENGQFYKLQQDYPQHCGPVRFSAKQILVAQDGLLPLTDTRNRQTNESFLELLLRVLWEKTSAAEHDHPLFAGRRPQNHEHLHGIGDADVGTGAR